MARRILFAFTLAWLGALFLFAMLINAGPIPNMLAHFSLQHMSAPDGIMISPGNHTEAVERAALYITIVATAFGLVLWFDRSGLRAVAAGLIFLWSVALLLWLSPLLFLIRAGNPIRDIDYRSVLEAWQLISLVGTVLLIVTSLALIACLAAAVIRPGRP